MSDDPIKQTFTAALDALVAQLKMDRSILAALLCGSLSHDTVWTRSDIDLVLVTVDDKKVEQGDLSIYADGVNVHAILLPRAEFRRVVEGASRNSFVHSFLTKGRLLYTHDASVAALCEGLSTIGARDSQLQSLRAATSALPSIYKAHKWFLTRGDLAYTALWILYAATPLAQLEVIGAGKLVDREVIPQAIALNPTFFKLIYLDLLNERKTREKVGAALDHVDAYISARATVVFKLVLDHLREAGDVRSSRDLEHYFHRNFNVSYITTACEYLADQGLIGKASAPARLTKKSNIDVQELAFFYLEPR
jgi:uncharacterized protein